MQALESSNFKHPTAHSCIFLSWKWRKIQESFRRNTSSYQCKYIVIQRVAKDFKIQLFPVQEMKQWRSGNETVEGWKWNGGGVEMKRWRGGNETVEEWKWNGGGVEMKRSRGGNETVEGWKCNSGGVEMKQCRGVEAELNSFLTLPLERVVLSYTPRPLYPWWKSTPYPLFMLLLRLDPRTVHTIA